MARHTSEFSGADLEHFLNEVAILSTRYNCKEIDRPESDEAHDQCGYGCERRRFMTKTITK
jgi:ATP-dependent Zn protease